MSHIELPRPSDLDVGVTYPDGIVRVTKQGLVDLTPWHIMERIVAVEKLNSMRLRYRTKYVPFARRQDNDDVACLDPKAPGKVIIVHDFAAEGAERRHEFESFWEWFRSAVDDMIDFE